MSLTVGSLSSASAASVSSAGSGASSTTNATNQAILYRVCAGNRQLVTRLRVHRSSLDARCAYVLESGATIFTWTGTLASKTTASTRAVYLALQLKASRGVGGGLGGATCAVVPLVQTQETAAFWSALDDAQEASGALVAASDDGADPSAAFFPHILYKVLGGRVEICGKGDTLHRKALASNAGFVLDTLNAVFCWLGAECGDRDAAVASARADELTKKTARPVVKEIDGRESPFFQAQMLGFDDDRILKEARKVAIGKIDIARLSPRTLASLASPTRSPGAAVPRPQSLPTELSPDLLRRQLESEAAVVAASAAAPPSDKAPNSASSRGSLSPRPSSPRAHSPRRSRDRQRAPVAATGTVGGGASKHRRRRSRGRHATMHHESRANKTQLTAAAIVAAAAAEEAAAGGANSGDPRRATHRPKRSTTQPQGLTSSPPAGMSPLLALNIPSGSPSSVAKTFAVLRSPRARMDDTDDEDDSKINNNKDNNDNSAKEQGGESDVAAGDVALAGTGRRASISGGVRKKLSIDTTAPAGGPALANDKSLMASPAPLSGRSDGDSSQIDAAVNLHTRDLREDIGMLRQQINQIESHITLIKLSGRQQPHAAAGGAATAAATAAATTSGGGGGGAASAAQPTLPVPNGSVIVRGNRAVAPGATAGTAAAASTAAAPAVGEAAPTVAPASAAPVVPPLPLAWFFLNLQSGEPFSLLGEYRVRVAVAAEDGGDSVLYATRVDSSSLHFDQLGSVRAVNKGQFRWTQSANSSVVVWIQCRDPNGLLVSNAQPSPRVLGKSASKGAGLTHGVVSQATNVFLSRSSSPTGSPRLQFVETGKSASALSRSTVMAAGEMSSMASSSASAVPNEAEAAPASAATTAAE